MKKIKITRNKPRPSSEEINARKDFGSVLKQHQSGTSSTTGGAAKGVFKFGWMHGVGLAIAAISVGAVLYFSGVFGNKGAVVNPTEDVIIGDKNQTIQPANNNDMISKAFIAPPIKGVDLPFDNYKVKTSQATVLTHKTGSKIKIPKNAFVDKDGKAVSGEVDIRYREFHDPVDFFISGIPMTYDSAGTQYHFESAGMMEIYAFRNGEVVKMNPDKLIEVEMVSNDKSSKFNIYKLDTLGKKWDCRGKDKVKEEAPLANNMQTNPIVKDTASFSVQSDVKAKQITEKISVVQADIRKIAEQKPKEPLKADKKKYQFNLEVDAKEFPDLAVYKGALFEVGAENKDFSDKYYKVTWDNAVLSEGKKGVNYMLTLTKGKETQKITVYPVFDGKNYEVAKTEFQTKFNVYNTKLEERKVEEKKLQDEYTARVQQLKQEQAAREKAWKEEQRMAVQAAQTTQRAVRLFSIDGFGIWNCDNPMALPKGNELAARFSDKQGNEQLFNNVYLVMKDRNALFNYYAAKFSNFTYNPSADNMVWAVTKDNKIAVFTYEEFAKIPRKKGAYNFEMNVSAQELKSDKEIRQFLGIARSI